MIQLRHISKSFKTPNGDLEVLKNINLHIQKGEIFGVIGLSGAGKSTLIRCINFLEKPSDGQVIFDGLDLAQLSKRNLRLARQSIGMIFQGFNLLSQKTALKNICYPLEIAGYSRKAAKEKALTLLELVGLSDKRDAYPAQLSGGQKQRVAIARALANDPKILLCDEATSALDPNTTRSILTLLQDINKRFGITIIIVTHEMHVIEQVCNRVAVIDKSEIVEMGEVQDVFIRPQSSIAKQLILPKQSDYVRKAGNRALRIVFDGISAFEPIISNMTLECGTVVNILFANTKNIDGKAFGEMVIQLPQDETAIVRILAYLNDRQINFREEDFNV